MTELSDPPLYGLPVPNARHARIVREGFWRKLRRVMGHVPFAEEVLAAYYCAIDPATPTRVRGLLLAAVAYFVVPADAIPDILAGVGFGDDAAVLAAVIGLVRGHIKERHQSKARAALLRPEPEADDA